MQCLQKYTGHVAYVMFSHVRPREEWRYVGRACGGGQDGVITLFSSRKFVRKTPGLLEVSCGSKLEDENMKNKKKLGSKETENEDNLLENP